MSNKMYDILKWLCLICIPAVTVFLTTVMPVLKVDSEMQTIILTIIPAVGTLIGSLIAVSTAVYNNKDGGHDAE